MKTFSTKPSINETKKNILCPLCGNDKYKTLWNLTEYSFSQCPKCNLVYQNPQPMASFVHERYSDSYFSYEIENEKSFLSLMLLGLKDIGFDSINVIHDNKKFLDIGCATGLLLSHMKELGWDTYGVEVCSSAVEYGNNKRGLNVFNGTIENSKYENDFFDVIHLSHVIEHINNPKDFINKIFDLLKPGGVVYCTTPNIDGFQAKLFQGKWRSVIADHMILFSIKTLSKLFKENNFIIKKNKTWGGLCANSGYPKLIKNLLDKLSKPLGFGDVVILKAVKPL